MFFRFCSTVCRQSKSLLVELLFPIQFKPECTSIWCLQKGEESVDVVGPKSKRETRMESSSQRLRTGSDFQQNSQQQKPKTKENKKEAQRMFLEDFSHGVAQIWATFRKADLTCSQNLETSSSLSLSCFTSSSSFVTILFVLFSDLCLLSGSISYRSFLSTLFYCDLLLRSVSS